MASRVAERLRTLLIIVGGALVVWVGIQGGEYSTADLLRQRNDAARLRHEIDSLTRAVDSLRRYRQRVLTDPKTQERIAREEFGMVRGRELLYRFADSTPSPPPATRPAP